MVSPSVRGGAVHVLLKPALKVSQLVLHPVHHLHGCIQVSTAQAVVDHRPHGVALDLTVLSPAQKGEAATEPSVNLWSQFAPAVVPSCRLSYVHIR